MCYCDGGLNTEALLRMLGHWLDGSGWVQCLVTAGVELSNHLLQHLMLSKLAMFTLLLLQLCLSV